jgi:hypothetical protein
MRAGMVPALFLLSFANWRARHRWSRKARIWIAGNDYKSGAFDFLVGNLNF